ncbi:class I SAM-dependent methyltransferase [Roseibacillus ishigakijimensis]|uniref:Class I SAM-dependent methyltransferase n=1 Tax=Roseibacillus ishigakijimensis TaxID=454146 RepID=A0A934RKK0_9BACT|nr:class I SAM-dependent methyltransferase [Roseibacillus ishigakijimensis]MBK1832553.1 class I SAM-dependent methyltransferase [Roseibacillus ishigakijimensis]
MAEPFHVIVSTMRSGSSLCGHLLAEAGWILYAGETHTQLGGEDGVAEAIARIREQGQGSRWDAPPCDKVLGHGHLPDEGEFVAKRAERIYLLLRHPLAIWRSQKETGWSFCSLQALADQLSLMRLLIEKVSLERLTVLSYYELTQKEGRRQLFGQSIEGYTPNAKAGQPVWGDPGELIASGRIRECSLRDDVERALPEVWMDLGDFDFARAMAEFDRILELTGKRDLAVNWWDSAFFAADALQIGGMSRREGVAMISVEEFRARRDLPCAAGAFDRIDSTELVHRCEPPELLKLLGELRRILREQGVLRLETIDFDFVRRLSLGQETDYVDWYRERILSAKGGVSGRVSVINHLSREWGHCYFYDRARLQALMGRAGFHAVREVPAGEWLGAGGGMPLRIHAKERFA